MPLLFEHLHEQTHVLGRNLDASLVKGIFQLGNERSDLLISKESHNLGHRRRLLRVETFLDDDLLELVQQFSDVWVLLDLADHVLDLEDVIIRQIVLIRRRGESNGLGFGNVLKETGLKTVCLNTDLVAGLATFLNAKFETLESIFIMYS